MNFRQGINMQIAYETCHAFTWVSHDSVLLRSCITVVRYNNSQRGFINRSIICLNTEITEKQHK